MNRERGREIRERLKVLDAEIRLLDAEIESLLLRIPNPADPDVPVGGKEANVILRTWGTPAPHWVEA